MHGGIETVVGLGRFRSSGHENPYHRAGAVGHLFCFQQLFHLFQATHQQARKRQGLRCLLTAHRDAFP